MSVQTDSQLTTAATVIQTETVTGANSASRVGTLLNNLAENKMNIDKIDPDVSLGANSDNFVPTVKAVKTYVDVEVLSSVTIDPDVSLGDINPLDTVVPSQKAVKTYVDASALITVKVSITSPEILTLNSTPKTLVATPGAGKIILPLNIIFYKHFVSAAYTTNTNLQLGPGTLYATIYSSEIAFTQNTIATYSIGVSAGSFTTSVINQPMNIYVTGANPLAGDGSLDIYLTYCIISL